VDSAGYIYVAGSTSSDTFPTRNAIQPHRSGGIDAFVTKMSPDGSTLVFSTYLGGRDEDSATDIAVDSGGYIHVTGTTASADFAVVNALQGTRAGKEDAFVVKLDSSGSRLFYSTYLGGTDKDSVQAVAVDANGTTWLAGTTQSDDFPTANPLQREFAGGLSDAFVVRLGANGQTLLYSSYLGGEDNDKGIDIGIDNLGSAVVAGSTRSADFPVTGGFQPEIAGASDVFVVRLDSDGSRLLSGTYLGDIHDEAATGLALDG